MAGLFRTSVGLGHAAVFAAFATNPRRERQMEGIAAAKMRGVYRGRKPKTDPAEMRRLHAAQQFANFYTAMIERYAPKRV